MYNPICRNPTDPLNSAILHLRIWVQPLGDRFGNDGAFVLLQSVNLGLDVGDKGIDFRHI